jgi:hypothetical protein
VGRHGQDLAVTTSDAQLLLDVVTKLQPETAYHRLVGNLNGDSRLDSADATLLLRLANDQTINPPAGTLDDYDLDTFAITIPSMESWQGSVVVYAHLRQRNKGYCRYGHRGFLAGNGTAAAISYARFYAG